MNPGTKTSRIGARLRPALFRGLAAFLSLGAGLAAAVVLHYLLYRVGIPGTPFIYVVF
jgi:hypothetical protein